MGRDKRHGGKGPVIINYGDILCNVMLRYVTVWHETT